jgi:hypothetical protein
MALNGDALKAKAYATVFAKLKQLKEPKINANMPPDGKVKLIEDWDETAQAVAEAMIDIIMHIKTFGEVMTTVNTTVTTVDVGTCSTGPVAATGTGTGVGTGTGAPGTAIF